MFNRFSIPAFLVFFLMSLVSAVPSGTAKPAEPVVRVLVIENQKDLRFTVGGRFKITPLPVSGRGAQTFRKAIGVSVAPSPLGLGIGGKDWVTRGVRLEPDEDNDLWLNASRFRGALDIWKDKNGFLYAINRVPLEEYLYGVLHHEVAPWWPMEALKAQAVAARTYARYQMSVSAAAEFDLKSTTSSQVYGGSTTERYRTKKAVDDTASEVLTYGGKIFPAYFHATCAGMTAGAAELWKIDLAPVAGGVVCDYCQISPHYYWHAKIPLSEIEEAFRANGRPLGQILGIEIVTQTPSHRAGSLRVTGTTQSALVAVKDFRVWMGGDRIRSAFFTVRTHSDAAEFSGKGWGHGVGLCQWGALGQALFGKNYKDILKFYYPGSEITSLRS
ncbi:MAG: SpoIID/LytB domain-containing protein [Candidatus Omnitrophica bacterium]|nr:SpoIID/LytB domain-containing protein [Candidatus Omnitrophota bacterium]